MTCWQKIQRDKYLQEDIESGFPTDIKARDFTLQVEEYNTEHKKFIERYEWLGTVGFNVKWVFTARYMDKLGGVVILSEPNAYQFDKEKEALIQRGACASWTPKNLASRLIMFSCKWMVKNTNKRIFVAYSDPDADEIGTVYQACNFDYLGKNFGDTTNYKLPNGKVVNSRYFTRTSSMKKWAKELNIEWSSDWMKDNGFQDTSKIPKDILIKLKNYAKLKREQCELIRKQSKGKYVISFNVEKTWTSLPYPKRNNEGRI